jgi:hypothetical protein
MQDEGENMRAIFYVLSILLAFTNSALAQTNSAVFAIVPTLDEGGLILLPVLIGVAAGWAFRKRNGK